MAWVLACTTFPLIWLGGTVTTYQAGMAVDTWPSSFGYWFYPPPFWLKAWDLFLEHGHRMLAQLVGVLTIALAVVLWKMDRREWMRWLAAAAVAGVCFQGLLGGLRVLFDERLLAKVHGCTAPLFFALCATLVTLTSAAWQEPKPPQGHPAARRLHRLALVVAAAVYLQIVLGAQLRHVAPGGWLGWFQLWVWLKLILAGLIAVGAVGLLVYMLRRVPAEVVIARRAKLLAVLFCVQLLLGAGTWVTKYNWPGWFRKYIWAVDYTPVQEGRLQVLVTTAHAAIGSLILVVALGLTLWSFRRLRGSPP